MSARHPAWVVSLALLACSSMAAGAGESHQGGVAWRVQFVSGSSIDVSSYTVDDGRLVLFLEDGGTFAVNASQVRRVDRVEIPVDPETPPSSPPPAPVDPPSSPGLPAAATAVGGGGAQPRPDPSDIDTLVNEAARRYGLEADLLAAVIAVESGYRINAVSPKGAQGLMQLMPGTARELAVTNAFDPAQNIDAGARHLKRLIDQNGGKYWRALAAYNAGEGNVARYKGLPPFRETMSYVRRVLDNYGKPRGGAPAPSAGR